MNVPHILDKYNILKQMNGNKQVTLANRIYCQFYILLSVGLTVDLAQSTLFGFMKEEFKTVIVLIVIIYY